MIYLTVKIVEAKDLKVDLTESKLTLEAGSGYHFNQDTKYKLELDFFKEIDVEHLKYDAKSSGNHILFVLRKKEAQDEYWPRLTKEKAKYNWLKTDFDKWVDEDEQDEKEEEEADPMANMGDMDFSSMLNGAGGGAGGFDFSKMAGMQGMPDLGLMGNAQDDEFSSSDDEAEAESKEKA